MRWLVALLLVAIGVHAVVTIHQLQSHFREERRYRSELDERWRVFRESLDKRTPKASDE